MLKYHLRTFCDALQVPASYTRSYCIYSRTNPLGGCNCDWCGIDIYLKKVLAYPEMVICIKAFLDSSKTKRVLHIARVCDNPDYYDSHIIIDILDEFLGDRYLVDMLKTLEKKTLDTYTRYTYRNFVMW